MPESNTPIPGIVGNTPSPAEVDATKCPLCDAAQTFPNIINNSVRYDCGTEQEVWHGGVGPIPDGARGNTRPSRHCLERQIADLRAKLEAAETANQQWLKGMSATTAELMETRGEMVKLASALAQTDVGKLEARLATAEAIVRKIPLLRFESMHNHHHWWIGETHFNNLEALKAALLEPKP